MQGGPGPRLGPVQGSPVNSPQFPDDRSKVLTPLQCCGPLLGHSDLFQGSQVPVQRLPPGGGQTGWTSPAPGPIMLSLKRTPAHLLHVVSKPAPTPLWKCCPPARAQCLSTISLTENRNLTQCNAPWPPPSFPTNTEQSSVRLPRQAAPEATALHLRVKPWGHAASAFPSTFP